VADAVRDQLVKMCYFAGSAGSIPGARYSEALTARMPGLSRVYFANSGSEANEKAFKMVRQISHKHHGGRKSKILYRDRDYHGTTIACLSAGGQQERNAQYGPFTPGFVQVPHCLEYRAADQAGEGYGARAANAIEEVILREGPDTIGALCLEPITGGRRHHRAPQGLLGAGAGDLPQVRHPPPHRRGGLRLRAHRDRGSATSSSASSPTSSPWPRVWPRATRDLVLRDHRGRVRQVQGRHGQALPTSVTSPPSAAAPPVPPAASR
jgi:hypothetical protein